MKWLDNARARKEASSNRYADRLDERLTRKALRRSPDSPVIIGRVITQREVEMLLGRGWRLLDSNPALFSGTSYTEFFLVKDR